jgi:hypothetical protein
MQYKSVCPIDGNRAIYKEYLLCTGLFGVSPFVLIKRGDLLKFQKTNGAGRCPAAGRHRRTSTFRITVAAGEPEPEYLDTQSRSHGGWRQGPENRNRKI